MKLFTLFFIFPLIETYFLVQFSGKFGFLTTLIMVILTAIIGSRLAKAQGLGIIGKLQNELKQGIPPSETLVEGVLILISGIVLLLPGLISDVLGILLLVPNIRQKIAPFILPIIKKTIKFNHFSSTQRSSNRSHDDNYVEYEVVDEDTQSKN